MPACKWTQHTHTHTHTHTHPDLQVDRPETLLPHEWANNRRHSHLELHACTRACVSISLQCLRFTVHTIFVYIYIYIQYICMCIYAYIYIYMYTYMYTCRYMCMYTVYSIERHALLTYHAYIHVYIYIYMPHKRIRTCTCTHIYAQLTTAPVYSVAPVCTTRAHLGKRYEMGTFLSTRATLAGSSPTEVSPLDEDAVITPHTRFLFCVCMCVCVCICMLSRALMRIPWWHHVHASESLQHALYIYIYVYAYILGPN